MPKNAHKLDTPARTGRKRLKAFDIALLRRYTFEDSDLERELLELFQAQLPLLIRQLAESKSQSEWHLAAHTLKGSARSVGAPALAELALELEQIGYQENPQRAKLATRVEAAVKAFATSVETYYGRS